ncbi:hypothetical protein [Neiella litorisoli]|nr:hypothetical protein [Neiella litorisoli]
MKRRMVKHVGLLALVLPLTACLDDDNDNKDVVAALEQQNALLEEQIKNEKEQNEQQAPVIVNSVTLYTSVVDAADYADAGPVIVHFKEGPMWREAIEFDTGEILITDIKPMSDYEMVISSPTDAFMRRAVFGKTQDSSTENSYQQLDAVMVSPPVQKSIKIINVNSDKAIDDLQLKAYSNIGEGGLSAETYAHPAIYDAATESYNFILPQDLDVIVYGSLDPDGDGEANYEIEYGAYDSYRHEFHFYASSMQPDAEIGVRSLQDDEPVTYTELQVRLSVLDENGNAVNAAEVAISDELNGELAAQFDAEQQQYVLDSKLNSSLSVNISAFESDGVFYGSSSVYIYPRDNGSFDITTSGNRYEYRYTSYATDGAIDLIIGPNQSSPTSALEVTAVADVSGANYQASIYYSSPIALLEGSTSLVQQDVWQVTYGNSDDNDLILPGTTAYRIVDVEVPHSAELMLNNTRLVLSSDLSLAEGYEYSYQVNEIEDSVATVRKNLYDDHVDFYSPVTSEFSIDDIVLDNRNYWSNGSELVPVNTAGIAANAYERRDSAYLHFPESIASLKNFTLSKVIIVEDGVAENSFSSYQIVSGGNIWISSALALPIAANENLVRDGNNYMATIRGTTLPEGRWYYVGVSSYINDDKESSENSITFDYSFETMDGEIKTGTITLSVM